MRTQDISSELSSENSTQSWEKSLKVRRVSKGRGREQCQESCRSMLGCGSKETLSGYVAFGAFATSFSEMQP